MVFSLFLNCAGLGGTVSATFTVAITTVITTAIATTTAATLQPTIMPRDPHRQTPSLAAAFKRRRGSRGRANLTLPRTRRATPPVDVHRWSAMTAEIVRRGPGDPTYEHVVDLYCRTDIGVDDASRMIMTYWKADACNICKHIYPRYSVCRHHARIIDLDNNNRGGFLVSPSPTTQLAGEY